MWLYINWVEFNKEPIVVTQTCWLYITNLLGPKASDLELLHEPGYSYSKVVRHMVFSMEPPACLCFKMSPHYKQNQWLIFLPMGEAHALGVQVYVCVAVHAHTCLHMWSMKTSLAVVPQVLSIIHFEAGAWICRSLVGRRGRLATTPQESTCLCLPGVS